MTRRVLLLATAILMASATFANVASAQLDIFRRNRSRPESIELSDKNGPWLIMCASFVGETGLEQAKALVQELRTNYKLDAYIYRHTFDHSNKIQAFGWDDKPNGDGVLATKQLVPAHVETYEEIAVVVGDFPSLDDAEAQKTLDAIKHWQPKSLAINEYSSTNQQLGALRHIQRMMSSDPEAKEKGPMAAAFLMPNPLLPEEYYAAPPLDDVILKANRGIQYSLLDCPGSYSVKVATFRGATTFSPHEIERRQKEYEDMLNSGRGITDSQLVEAAENAHLMTVALRKMGVEAYEFHDHHESYVCVGSFDWAKQQTASGIQTNPDIANVIAKFKATDAIVNGYRTTRRRTINVFKDLNINFDAQPLPITVPKAPARVARGLFGR